MTWLARVSRSVNSAAEFEYAISFVIALHLSISNFSSSWGNPPWTPGTVVAMYSKIELRRLSVVRTCIVISCAL